LNFVFENTNLEGVKEDRTLVKFAWQVGFGLTINITNNINFDIGVNYQSNFYQHDAMNTGFEYATGFGFAF
jgi:opacity protein-like surface antigen